MTIGIPPEFFSSGHEPLPTGEVKQATKRVEIAEEDLPPGVQQDLRETYYEDDAVFVEAFKHLDEEGTALSYEVRIARDGREDVVAMYDREGRPLGNGPEDNRSKENENLPSRDP